MNTMGLRTLSCFLALALLVLAGMAEGQCSGTDPDPCVADCTGCVAGDKVPNPEDCHTFYVCEDATDYLDLVFDCDEGEVFNITLRECDADSECTECAPTSTCSYVCTASTPPDIVTIASNDDCNIYYTCDDTGDVDDVMTCEAEKPFYDGVECQTDERRCCHCKLPVCSVTGLIPDPLDCRGYYLCTVADGSPPTIHGLCDDGENFDINLNGCSPMATCNTRCTNVVGADGCIEPFTCLEIGYFARCPLADECTAEYYHCAQADGTYQEAESCPGGQVFNPNTHNCASEC